MMVEQPRKDPLTKREFEAACRVLDREPQPETPEQANELWRQFVGAVWLTLSRHRERETRARRALTQRGGQKNAKRT